MDPPRGGSADFIFMERGDFSVIGTDGSRSVLDNALNVAGGILLMFLQCLRFVSHLPRNSRKRLMGGQNVSCDFGGGKTYHRVRPPKSV